MKTVLLIMVMTALATLSAAPVNGLDLDELMQTGERWLLENADDDTLAALGELDDAQLEKLCRQVQERFAGESVIDLAALKKLAAVLVPLLERDAETRPFAAWLKARLDYLDVAERLRPAKPPPGPIHNPPPQTEREAWRRQLLDRPALPAARDYAARLKAIFATQRVPVELVWLAEVESAFDPRAKSPVGAAGLFQLMPATARQLGLNLQPDDERFNPERSTAAAAKYLQYLYGKFHDWRLVLAAYNAGEGRVRELLTRNKATTFDAIAVRLPAETQLYVPKVEATILRREGVSLTRLAAPSRD